MKAAKPDANNQKPVLDLLLEKADKKGHLTMDDLEEIIPLSGSSTTLIDEMVNTLIERGVEVVETKETSSTDLLGCSTKHARQHLESQFTKGMTWENHGVRGWHIDHIIPCDSFDLSDINQKKQCFHYTNLQPLWYKENLSKGDKLPDQHQPQLLIKL